ncbi:hypothetical protein ACFPRL_24035 [Pseudoclavibacter helvolus]
MLSRTRHDLAALSSCRHLTTLARNEAPVEISIEHRSAPSAHHRRRDTSVLQPRTFRSIRATLVREHQITHFFVTEPHSDRHHDLLQITSQTTHNQPDKEGWHSQHMANPRKCPVIRIWSNADSRVRFMTYHSVCEKSCF